MRRILAYWIALSFSCCTGAHAGLSDTVNRIPEPGASFTTQNQEFHRDEDSDRFHETACREETFIFSGCLGATAASLSHTPSACIAYARGYRLTEAGSITYSNASTCWVIYDRQTTGDLVSSVTFTRVASTHYLRFCGAASPTPTLPAGTGFLMQVTTAAGAITAVTDLRDFGACGEGSGFQCEELTTQACDLCPLIEACEGSGCAPPYCDVKCFGAIGDGVTDDTVAIQAAFDACALDGYSTPYDEGSHTNCRGGGTVFFPRTSIGYRTTGTIFGCGVSMLGEGPDGSMLLPDDFGTCAGATPYICTPAYRLQSADDTLTAPDWGFAGGAFGASPSVENLALQGPVSVFNAFDTDGGQYSTTDAIHLENGTSNFSGYFDHVHIAGFRNGIYDDGQFHGLAITRSTLEYNYYHVYLGTSGDGFALRDSNLGDASFAAIGLKIDLEEATIVNIQGGAWPYFIFQETEDNADNFLGNVVIESVVGRYGNGFLYTDNFDAVDTGIVCGLHLRNTARMARIAGAKIAARSDAYAIQVGPIYCHNEFDLGGQKALGDSAPQTGGNSVDQGTTGLVYTKSMLGTVDFKIKDLTAATITFDGGFAYRWKTCDVYGLCLPAGVPDNTASDTTPSVAGIEYMTWSWSAPVNVTNLDDGRTGQRLLIRTTNTNTTINDGGNFKLTGNFVSTADDAILLLFDGTSWVELARSVN